MAFDRDGCCDKLEALLRTTPLPTIEWDLDRRVASWNPAAEHVFGFSRREALGRRPDEDLIVPADRRCQALANWRQVVEEGRSLETVAENLTRAGERIRCAWYLTPLFDEAGRVAGVLSQAQDVTVLKSCQRQLHSLAFFDPLTGLPNRALFCDRIDQAIGRSTEGDEITGLMMVGLDRLKAVNDALGHGAGDEVLREAAARLLRTVRGYDTVARFGGDEFAIAFPGIREGAALGRIARKVLDAFAEPILVDGNLLFVSVSVGIALHPQDSQDVKALLRFAAAALVHAKAQGRNNFQFYSAELTARAVERLDLEAGLRVALERGELDIHYQPQVDLSSGRLVGAEALLRWRHPNRGMVPPDRFIGIAEETGLIVGIGEWVLRNACAAARDWHAAGQEITVAVNLSARQFQGGGLAATVAGILRETGCRPEWLELEITESLLLEDGKHVRQTLEQLTGMGIAIAIDDFGTGYSALAYINRLPVAVLKIDRSFVSDVIDNQGSAELARAIASMARTLRLRVVAEGVENEAQESFLRACGCQVGQGYLYGKPMPRQELEILL